MGIIKMAHLEYYNNIVGINDMIYDSHKLLLEKITMELGHYDKFDELCEKFLDQPKLKAKVDKNAPKKSKFNLGVVQKKLGEMWSSLGETELEKYNKSAEEDKERYQEEYEAYQEQIYGSIYHK